jgi:hypothetical protein
MTFALGAFFAGVIVGLIIGPDSEREHSAKTDGWIAGFTFARRSSRAVITPTEEKQS